MNFTGQLRQGKLTGTLEATANGKLTASGAKGRVVGQGTWVMDRARAHSRTLSSVHREV